MNLLKLVTNKYYAPTPSKWRKLATSAKLLIGGLAGLITKDAQLTANICLVGCLICDFIVNLLPGEEPECK